MVITTEDKLKECVREIKQRERVYRRLVAQGKLAPDVAERQLDIMKEIASDYFRLQATEAKRERTRDLLDEVTSQ